MGDNTYHLFMYIITKQQRRKKAITLLRNNCSTCSTPSTLKQRSFAQDLVFETELVILRSCAGSFCPKKNKHHAKKNPAKTPNFHPQKQYTFTFLTAISYEAF